MNKKITSITIKAIALTFLISLFIQTQAFASVSIGDLPTELPNAPSQYISLQNGSEPYPVTYDGKTSYPDTTQAGTGMFKMYASERDTYTVKLNFVKRDYPPNIACGNFLIRMTPYRLWRSETPKESMPFTDRVVNSSQDCESSSIEFSFPKSAFNDQRSTVSEHKNLYVAAFKLEVVNKQANSSVAVSPTFTIYTLSNDRARVGFWGGRNDGVAIYPSNEKNNHTVDFKFRPTCDEPTGQKSVSWSSALGDHDNQRYNSYHRSAAIDGGSPGDLSVAVYRNYVSSATRIAYDTNPTDSGSLSFNHQKGDSYILRFKDVTGGNRIKVAYPFDSGDFGYDRDACNTPKDKWVLGPYSAVANGAGTYSQANVVDASGNITGPDWLKSITNAKAAIDASRFTHGTFDWKTEPAPINEHRWKIQYKFVRAGQDEQTQGSDISEHVSEYTGDVEAADADNTIGPILKFRDGNGLAVTTDTANQDNDWNKGFSYLYRNNNTNGLSAIRIPQNGDKYCERIHNTYFNSSIGGLFPSGDADWKCVTLDGSCHTEPWDTQAEINDFYNNNGHSSAWVGDIYSSSYRAINMGPRTITDNIDFRHYDGFQSINDLFTLARTNDDPNSKLTAALGEQIYGPFYYTVRPQDAGRTHNDVAVIASKSKDASCNLSGEHALSTSIDIPYFYHLYPKATVNQANIQQSDTISVSTTMTMPEKNVESGTNDIDRPHTWTNPISYRTTECTISSGNPWVSDKSENGYSWSDSAGTGPIDWGTSKGGKNCRDISGLSGDNKVWRNNILNESVGSGDIRSGPDTILPVGTKVCYFLSVNQGYYDALNGPGGWRHSEPSCTTIIKTPKVRFENNDVLVGRHLPKSLDDSDCDPLMNADIKTAGTTKYITDNPGLIGGAVNQTGSWGEYGVFATGDIVGFGSAAFSVGQNNTDVRRLQFGNQTPSGRFAAYGSACTFNWFAYTPKGATNIPTDNITVETQSGKTLQYTKNRSWNISANAPLLASFAPTVLYAKASQLNSCSSRDGSGVIEITSDIMYENSYLDAKQLPRTILMADCGIIIHQNVSRLDVSLITRGVLNTCDRRQDNSSFGLGVTKNNYRLTKNDCTMPLTVGGIVAAKKVNFLRTTSSDLTNLANITTPAENFAQNPSVLISAYAQAFDSTQLTSAEETELPPRY